MISLLRGSIIIRTSIRQPLLLHSAPLTTTTTPTPTPTHTPTIHSSSSLALHHTPSSILSPSTNQLRSTLKQSLDTPAATTDTTTATVRRMVSTSPYKSQENGGAYGLRTTQPLNRPILMIPGPTEYHPEVLHTLSLPSISHTSPAFIEEFGQVLEKVRTVLKGDNTTQPLVLSGSGTLGWDVIVSNFTERGNKVLVLNTGYFSDSYAVCCETYGLEVHQLHTHNIGDTIEEERVIDALQQNSYALICITQVDTSTAVLNNAERYSRIIRQYQPDTLISVDGVCSFGGESFDFSGWDIDCAMSCSQKALGCPPGLSVALFSPRAMKRFQQRQTPVPSYYANLHYWLPIMNSYEQRKPSYFATPNVNLIRAMNTSLSLIIQHNIDRVIEKHQRIGSKFRAALHALNLRVVPTGTPHAANTLSAIYYPSTDQEPTFQRDTFLGNVTKHGVIIAAGLHKKIKTEYFRVGTMGYSVWNDDGRDDVRQAVQSVELALIESGAKNVVKGSGLKAYDNA